MKFQRTRGVLRLMAAVIHSLWEKGDRNPLILPANIPIDDPRVQFELTRYLSDNWVPVIEKDVDGPNSLPLRLDGEVPEPGQVRRLPARGAHDLPRLGADRDGRQPRHRGPAHQARLRDARRVPGHLRRCAAPAGSRRDLPLPGSARATGTRPSRPSRSWPRIAPSSSSATRTRSCRSSTSGCAPTSARRGTSAASIRCRHRAQDVPDDLDARLVVLGIDHPYSKEAGNSAEVAAKAILETRGNAPRLLPEHARLPGGRQDTAAGPRRGVRRYLAWEFILDEKEALTSRRTRCSRPRRRRASADSAVTARLPEAYQWLLVPVQANPQAERGVAGLPATGIRTRSPCGRARSSGTTSCWSTGFAATRLTHGAGPGTALARRPRCNQAARRGLRPLPLSAAASQYRRTARCVRDGLRLLTWEQDSFAYADSFDEQAGRYRGLRCGQMVNVTEDNLSGLLVQPGPAEAQRAARLAPSPEGIPGH